jgi:hypothetical protein
MRKISGLIALALLAVAGTGYAVTCAYDNVPAATLLVPYFRVSRNGATSVTSNLPDLPNQIDTLVSVTNVSNTGIIIHVTVWNKYSVPVLDFNVPLTAFDVAFWRMRDILNGSLNVNPLTQSGSISTDPCGINQTNGVYSPATGFGRTTFIRFANPNPNDARASISRYGTPAFTGNFRRNVWDALDESGDVTNFASPGANVLDDDTACGDGVNGVFAGDFSGYVTIDVVNYCTNFFPDQADYYVNDAIATRGWAVSGYSPNAIIGDVFYVDTNTTNNNISGDQAVPLEFDGRLDWLFDKTFYGRYNDREVALGTTAPERWRFRGDGREPLGNRYGFRYLSDTTLGLRSWAIVWRGDRYEDEEETTLCNFWGSGGAFGTGLYDGQHALAARTFDNDENEFVTGGGPSPGPGSINLYVFLETQRIDLLGNSDINPGLFRGGYMDVTFPGTTQFNQTYVGIQHSGSGNNLLSVGHSATLLSNQFVCVPDDNFGQIPGNIVP